MQPVWAPDGTRLAWVEWDHPFMPWVGSRVMTGAFDRETLKISDVRTVAGGTDFPADQPRFSPDGRYLSYIVSNGEWQDIALFELETGERHVLVHGADAEFSQPAFVMGIRTTAWFGDSRRLLFRRQRGVRSKIGRAHV